MKNLKIALLGYGKMGKIIENICLERGHTIICTIDNQNDWEQKLNLLQQAQIAIDFSMPTAALENIYRCFELKLPIVVGTTGWYDHLNALKLKCVEDGQSLFYAPNYSLGMNIVFRLNRQLGRLINKTNYKVSLHEIHHIHKLDAPSGTALQLANDLIDQVDELKKWEIGVSKSADVLPIEVERMGEVNGFHEIIADSPEDVIRIQHDAKGRRGFALGAVLAAEFLNGKKGLFNMDDLLDDTI